MSPGRALVASSRSFSCSMYSIRLEDREEFLRNFSRQRFIAAQDRIHEGRLSLDEKRPTTQLFARDKRASGAREAVEHEISDLGAALEILLVQRWRLGRRVFVLVRGQALREPYVEEVHYVVDGAISRSDFAVENFVQIAEFSCDILVAARRIYARFVSSVERDLRRGVDTVFDPEAHPPGRESRFS